MGYRDDREALRSEVDTLQKELESAREDQQRLAGLEERLDAARREVGAIEAELSRSRGRAPARRGALVVGLMGALAVFAAIGGFVVVYRPRPPVVATAPIIARPTPVVPAIVPTVTAPHALAKPAPARRASAVWTATVTKASGVPLHAGSPCTIRAGVIPD